MPNSKSNRMYILDYIKAVCIILVIINHCEITYTNGNDFLMPFWVAMAVPIFIMVSGFTLSIRMEHRKGSIVEYYKGLPKDFLHILIPYTISSILIVVMKLLFSDNVLTVKDVLLAFISGSIGTGGYFVIVYLQLLVVFPFVYKRLEKNSKISLVIIIAINIVFELVVAILNQQGFEFLEIYKIISLRYISHFAIGCYMYLKKNWMFNIKKIAILLLGGGISLDMHI